MQGHCKFNLLLLSFLIFAFNCTPKKKDLKKSDHVNPTFHKISAEEINTNIQNSGSFGKEIGNSINTNTPLYSLTGKQVKKLNFVEKSFFKLMSRRRERRKKGETSTSGPTQTDTPTQNDTTTQNDTPTQNDTTTEGSPQETENDPNYEDAPSDIDLNNDVGNSIDDAAEDLLGFDIKKYKSESKSNEYKIVIDFAELCENKIIEDCTRLGSKVVNYLQIEIYFGENKEFIVRLIKNLNKNSNTDVREIIKVVRFNENSIAFHVRFPHVSGLLNDLGVTEGGLNIEGSLEVAVEKEADHKFHVSGTLIDFSLTFGDYMIGKTSATYSIDSSGDIEADMNFSQTIYKDTYEGKVTSMTLSEPTLLSFKAHSTNHDFYLKAPLKTTVYVKSQLADRENFEVQFNLTESFSVVNGKVKLGVNDAITVITREKPTVLVYVDPASKDCIVEYQNMDSAEKKELKEGHADPSHPFRDCKVKGLE